MIKKAIGIIPVRMESTRLPQKPLLDICGLPMILHTLHRASLAKSLSKLFVATDSNEIAHLVESNGGNVILTRSDHETGSDRIAEASQFIDADYIVNIQGDEALLNPSHIDIAVTSMDELDNIGMLVAPLAEKNSNSDVKVVLNNSNEILYMSRADIPFNTLKEDIQLQKAYHLVPFKKDFLIQFSKWPKGNLERIENIEYLRILEKGFKIKAFPVDYAYPSVDTLKDLEFVRSKMMQDEIFPTYRSR